MGLWDSRGPGRKAEAQAGTGSGGVPRDGSAGQATRGAGGPGPAAVHGAPWAPRIDADACRGCGTCLDECPTGVFAMGRRDTSARVASPEDCRTECERCATHCPEEGISFPGRVASGSRS